MDSRAMQEVERAVERLAIFERILSALDK